MDVKATNPHPPSPSPSSKKDTRTDTKDCLPPPSSPPAAVSRQQIGSANSAQTLSTTRTRRNSSTSSAKSKSSIFAWQIGKKHHRQTNEDHPPRRLVEYRPIVYKNVLESVQQVVIYMKTIGLECEEYPSQALVEKVLKFKPGTTGATAYFPTDIAEAIHQLRKNPIIPQTMDEHSSDFYLMDSTGCCYGWAHLSIYST